MLSPLFPSGRTLRVNPLSNRFILAAQFSIYLRGGEIMRGGFAPSLLNSPLQPGKNLDVYKSPLAGEG
jgi:hypothetical protein